LARRLIEQPGKRVGEVLVEEGLGTADLVAAGLRRQRASRLEALYGLSEALIRFHVPRPRTGYRPAPLSTREFLYGRPRARARFTFGAGSFARKSSDPKLGAYLELGLRPGASARDIQRAFRKLAAERHPDRFPHASAREKAAHLAGFAKLSAAYHLLLA
jgi:hypothetical protein